MLSIAECELDLQIRTIVGLREEADVDALLLGDCKTLIADQRQYMDDRFTNRLRFSIAHEPGKYVLHRDVLKSIPRIRGGERVQFMREMPEREYGFLEFHAYEFVGRFLVPLKELASDFEKGRQDLESKGLLRGQLSEENTRNRGSYRGYCPQLTAEAKTWIPARSGIAWSLPHSFWSDESWEKNGYL